MLLWLPLSLGNALAASLAMQLQQGECHPAAATMAHEDMADHHGMTMDHEMPDHDHAAMQADDDTAHCTSCGICHLACAACLHTPAVTLQLAEIVSLAVNTAAPCFVSHITVPLLPPPLVAA
ncbi:MAG: hypothetical protein Fur0040_03400 [Sideroxydans sp.]